MKGSICVNWVIKQTLKVTVLSLHLPSADNESEGLNDLKAR